MEVLFICSHPDDEVLGCGGIIAKHAYNGDNVYVCFVSEGVSAQYRDEDAIEVRRTHTRKAGGILGVKEFFFFDLPDIMLDNVPQLEVVKVIGSVVTKIKPEILYTHYGQDINSDHRIVNKASLVWCRPSKVPSLKKVLFYEVFGSTYDFIPNYYHNIDNYMAQKILALSQYETEITAQTRSVETIKKQAAYRGAEVNLAFAEAFFLYKEITL